MPNYKLKPIKKLFSKKIVYPNGIPDRTISLARNLGMLTEKQYELLLAIKYDKEYDTNSKELLKFVKNGVVIEV